MVAEIKLPALGESVTEGTIVRWLKAVGDEVAFDEPLLEVATDKIDTEIPSPAAGRLTEIAVGEDQTVPVGTRIGLIDPADAEPASRAVKTASGPLVDAPVPGPVGKPDLAAAPKSSAIQEKSVSTFVTPLVRRIAGENGIDLAALRGSGLGGRIRKQDVLGAVAAQRDRQSVADPPRRSPTPGAAAGPVPEREAAVSRSTRESEGPRVATPQTTAADRSASDSVGRRERMSSRRKVIAARMVESLQTSAQLTSVVEVDVTSVYRLRADAKERFASQYGLKLTYLPFFAKATLDALRDHPVLNASIDAAAGEVVYYERAHLALAVDTPQGLITPVLRDAGDLTVAGLARNIADLADRARTNRISPDELVGGTFTLTNTGSRGSLFDTPIINQPQVAVLGTGSVVKRVVVVDDDRLGETIAVRQMAYMALTYDHRLVDGADAARFLTDVAARLEGGVFEL